MFTKKNTPITVAQATAKLEYYCAYQERCHKEVTQKLKTLGMVPPAIDHIIGHLLQENYLNETRFAQTFARSKFNQKQWGKNRITQELKARDISTYNIKIALKEINPQAYLQTLENLAEKKAASFQEGSPQKNRKKLTNYLLYRGWESHLVYEQVKRLI